MKMAHELLMLLLYVVSVYEDIQEDALAIIQENTLFYYMY